MKKVFQNNKLPILCLNGVGTELFADAKEIGLEKQIPKINKIIAMNSDKIPKISVKDLKSALNTREIVNVIIGPNNVHDILDSLKENH